LDVLGNRRGHVEGPGGEMLAHALGGHVESQLAGDDRTAELAAELLAVEVLLGPARKERLRDERLGLPLDERGPMELVAAGLGDRVEDTARRIADLGAEVLGFDLIFLDRDLRERVAERTEVLAEHAAVVDGVLEAHPVEEDV